MWVLLLSVTISGCAQVANNQMPNTTTIIKNIANVSESMVTFSAYVEEGFYTNQTISYKIWTQGEKTRIEFKMPIDIVQIYNKNTLWLLDNERMLVFAHEIGTTYRYDLDKSTSDTIEYGGAAMIEFNVAKDDVFTTMLKLSELGIDVITSEKIENEDTIVLIFRDGKEGELKTTWWVSTKSWFPVKRKIEFENLDYERTITYRDYKINETLDSSLFDLPQDFTITGDPAEFFIYSNYNR